MLSARSFTDSFRYSCACFFLVSETLFAQTSCYSLDPANLSSKPAFSALKERGRYCLKGSVTQQPIQVYISGFKPKALDLSFFAFATSEATLDLGGNDITSVKIERPVVTVLAPYKKLVGHSVSEAPDRDFVFHSLRVTNGRLNVPGNRFDAVKIPTLSLLVSLQSDFNDRLISSKFLRPEKTTMELRKELEGFFQRNGMKHWGNSVDNLEIIAGRTAVNMSGMNNAVRDSKIIVTDSFAGTYMFGPGTVIENNIFIFRGMARTESAAPIKLHFGDKALIRNNIFIIEEAELAPEQAISLIQSERVTITGNRVFGNAALVRKYDEKTTTIEQDNVVLPLSERPIISPEMRAASQVDLTRTPRRVQETERKTEAD